MNPVPATAARMSLNERRLRAYCLDVCISARPARSIEA